MGRSFREKENGCGRTGHFSNRLHQLFWGNGNYSFLSNTLPSRNELCGSLNSYKHDCILTHSYFTTRCRSRLLQYVYEPCDGYWTSLRAFSMERQEHHSTAICRMYYFSTFPLICDCNASNS